ncbi:hypothetical protein OAP14_11570, partial [Aliiglaciecola sp.]|nr:hypothetical protein [Aliiglaciecola sp.]
LGFVIYVGYLIATSSDPVAVNGWLVFMPLDFPISLGMIPLAHVVDYVSSMLIIESNSGYNVLKDVNNFWFPAVYSGVAGSAWWYFLSNWCVKLVTNRFAK